LNHPNTLRLSEFQLRELAALGCVIFFPTGVCAAGRGVADGDVAAKCGVSIKTELRLKSESELRKAAADAARE